MRNRCRNPRNTAYKDYGGRGITVCERWNLYEDFLQDMGRRPSGEHSIDRIDNDGPYSPENCRWVLTVVQVRNRRTTRLITVGSETRALFEWIELGVAKVSSVQFYNRLRAGMSPEEALTKPSLGTGGKGRTRTATQPA